MPALTTIDLLEQAVGRTLDVDETEQAQYFIDLVSEHIISYTGVDFTSTEKSVRLKADYYGVVYLPSPVASVAFVGNWRSDSPHPRAQWDGLNEIYGLGPVEVVDITFTSGYDSIPDEISMVATEASKRLLESPSGQGTGPLTRYRVGDVEEAYRAVDVSSLGGMFNDLEKMILSKYRQTETTWRIGSHQPSNLDNIPSSESALYE